MFKSFQVDYGTVEIKYPRVARYACMYMHLLLKLVLAFTQLSKSEREKTEYG